MRRTLGISLLAAGLLVAAGGVRAEKAQVTMQLEHTPMSCLAAVTVSREQFREHPDFLFTGERIDKLEGKILYMIGSGFETMYLSGIEQGLSLRVKAFIANAAKFDDILDALRRSEASADARRMEHFLADCQVAIDEALASELRRLRTFRSRAIRNLTDDGDRK